MIDRPHYHLFQPFLYHVAPRSVSTGEIATPRRDVSNKQRNTPIWLLWLPVFAFLFWCASTAFADAADAPLSSTNIFAPASTPAKSIFGLSLFVLVITGLIFVVVFTLLVYAIVKFGSREADTAREPAQVYGSTQIEL